jgi:hypothetical protein
MVSRLLNVYDVTSGRSRSGGKRPWIMSLAAVGNDHE